MKYESYEIAVTKTTDTSITFGSVTTATYICVFNDAINEGDILKIRLNDKKNKEIIIKPNDKFELNGYDITSAFITNPGTNKIPYRVFLAGT